MSPNQSIVARYFNEVCNQRKLAVADEIFVAGHVYHDPSSPWVGNGPEGQKELVAVYQAAFPDAHWKVEAMYETGDTVVTRWTGTGTHRGDLQGLAPTGKSVQVAGVWIQRLADGKIVESWNIWDTYGMMQQLGAAVPVGQVV